LKNSVGWFAFAPSGSFNDMDCTNKPGGGVFAGVVSRMM